MDNIAYQAIALAVCAASVFAAALVFWSDAIRPLYTKFALIALGVAPVFGAAAVVVMGGKVSNPNFWMFASVWAEGLGAAVFAFGIGAVGMIFSAKSRLTGHLFVTLIVSGLFGFGAISDGDYDVVPITAAAVAVIAILFLAEVASPQSFERPAREQNALAPHDDGGASPAPRKSALKRLKLSSDAATRRLMASALAGACFVPVAMLVGLSIGSERLLYSLLTNPTSLLFPALLGGVGGLAIGLLWPGRSDSQ